MRLKRLLFISMCMTALTSWAQESVNMKFGKPTKEELEMTTYEADPQADAVVLCRLTNVNYTIQPSGYLTDYHEKVRIKVLKPAGERYARVTIPYNILNQDRAGVNASKLSLRAMYFSMGPVNSSSFEGAGGSLTENIANTYTSESVEDLKATAYNMVNGKVVKSRLKNSEVKKEKIDDDTWQVSFTVPDVREGTVIEYEYNIHSELFYRLRDWYAQCEIPVVYACLDMDIPSYLIFNMEEHGIQRLVCRCVTGSMSYKLESDPLAAPVQISTNHYTCIGRNLKAMPKDIYVWNANDYCAGITAELKSFNLHGTMQTPYVKTWDHVDEILLEDPSLGRQLNNHSPLQKELQDARIPEMADAKERAVAVFQMVQKHTSWDGKYELWPRMTTETLKQGKGSNADINMLLIQSLKDVGLEAYPVVLRSRDQGLLPYNFPSFQKLTTFVVAIKVGSQEVYVDASSVGGYLNVLPALLLVKSARLVAPDKKSRWVDLQRIQKSKTAISIQATLSPDGTIQGTQNSQYEGLAALLFRQQKHIQDFVPKATDSISVTYKTTAADGQVSFCPFPVPPIQENPFIIDSRLMPIEFPCLSSETVAVNITLPEGYELAEKPEQYNLTTPDKALEGHLFTSQTGRQLQVHYTFNVNKVLQDTNNYPAIRQMYETFANYGRTMLVIKPIQ